MTLAFLIVYSPPPLPPRPLSDDELGAMAMKELCALQSRLERDFPGCALIPARSGGKIPKYAHKNGAWSHDKARDGLAKGLHEFQHGALLLLDKDLVVVDADTLELCAFLEQRFPAFTATVACQTAKGRHYYFRRPALPAGFRLTDGARQLVGDDGEPLPLDIKTECSTATRGVISIPPSPGKQWLRCLLQHEPLDLPPEFVEWFDDHRAAHQAPAPQGGFQSPHDAELTQQVVQHPVVRTPGNTYVHKLLALLAKHRWHAYASWRDIATALKNAFGEEFRAAFTDLSRICPNFEAAACDRLWESVAAPDFAGRRLTVRSIEAWAKNDDPIGYAAAQAARELTPLLQANLARGDKGLAAIAAEVMQDTLKKPCRRDNNVYLFEHADCAWKLHTVTSIRMPLTDALLPTLQTCLAHFNIRLSTATDQDARKAIMANIDTLNKHAAYAMSFSGMTRIAALAADLCYEGDFEQMLDAQPHLIGVLNGVIDLRDGSLRQRKPEDMIYNVAPVTYDPNADSGPWQQTVLDIMAGSHDMARFLQLLLGYAITGEVCEEIFPVFTASGRNGKGLLTQTLARLLGRFYRDMHTGLIVDRQVCNTDAERAKLLGSRIAIFNELRAGDKLKTHEVQLLSGGDGIPAKPMYKDPLTISPKHLCILTTNHMPELSEVIPAIVQRLLCIHFPVTFTELRGQPETPFVRQVDTGLKARLRNNDAGTFRWLVDGAVAWYSLKNNGGSLKTAAPEPVLAFSASYFEQQDVLGEFIKRRCVVAPDSKVASVRLLHALNQDLDDDGGQRWSDKRLGKAMLAKGFEKRNIRAEGTRTQFFVGLELAD